MASGKISPSKLKEDFLSCSLCMEDFRDPRCLDCLHTVCFQCLTTYAKSQGADQPGQCLLCPLCRSVTTIPDEGLSALRKNHFVKGLLDMTETIPESKPCGLCTEGQPSVVMCLDCNRGLCDFCHQAHSRQVFFKGHRIATFEALKDGKYVEERKTAAELCEEHLMQKDLFCNLEECQQSICMKCKIVNHEGHPTQTLAKRSSGDRVRLEVLRDALAIQESDEEKELNKGEQSLNQITKTMEQGRKSISNKVEAVKCSVQQEGQLLLKKYDAMGKKALENVGECLQTVKKDLKDRNHLRAFIDELLRHSNQTDLVSMTPAALRQGGKLLAEPMEAQDWNRWEAPTFYPGDLAAYMQHIKQAIGNVGKRESPAAVKTSTIHPHAAMSKIRVSACKENDDMVDGLVKGGYLNSPEVVRVFRAVDRGSYFLPDHRSKAYDETSWKSGNIHLSSPCIYSTVLEHLQLSKGMSFLNIGSGTGYLSTMAGLLIGSGGSNLGVEIHENVVEYANQKLLLFQNTFRHFDQFDFCPPCFVVGNGLQLNYFKHYFDRIYCGADCPADYEEYMKKLVKQNGILVMPYKGQLLQATRIGDMKWKYESFLKVSFAPLQLP